MNKETAEKIGKVLELANNFLIPLAEQGVEMTKNTEDDLIVALFKGGIPEVQKKLEEIGSK